MNITLIPGDGVGPELAQSLRTVFSKLVPDITFDEQGAGAAVYEATGEYIPQALLDSLEESRVAIKGPITTPIGHGFRSINVELRKRFDLYANVRPIRNLGSIPTKYPPIDLVIFRENTEDLYAGIEEEVSPGVVHGTKVITYAASERLLRKAFEYASLNQYPKVTVVTKANIMKLADGLFLQAAREVAKDFPELEVEEILVDNMCMQLVLRPEDFGIIATLNLYGDILSDLCAGLIGGLGIVPGANLGKDIAIFESVHGSALDIAGQGLVNPTAFLLSAAMMLDHLEYRDEALRLRRAIDLVLKDPANYTKDLGGYQSTTEYTERIVEAL